MQAAPSLPPAWAMPAEPHRPPSGCPRRLSPGLADRGRAGRSAPSHWLRRAGLRPALGLAGNQRARPRKLVGKARGDYCPLERPLEGLIEPVMPAAGRPSADRGSAWPAGIPSARPMPRRRADTCAPAPPAVPRPGSGRHDPAAEGNGHSPTGRKPSSSACGSISVRSVLALPSRTISVRCAKSTSFTRSHSASMSRMPVPYSRRASKACSPSICASTACTCPTVRITGSRCTRRGRYTLSSHGSSCSSPARYRNSSADKAWLWAQADTRRSSLASMARNASTSGAPSSRGWRR